MNAAILARLLVVTLTVPAAAEWGLYVNRDDTAWKMERTFAFEKDCLEAAHTMWKTGTVKGLGCQEYQPRRSLTEDRPSRAPIGRGNLPRRTAH